MIDLAKWLSTTSRSSPFLLQIVRVYRRKSAGIKKTLVPSSATEISQSHLSLQTSCSRVPVFTLNSAIFCRWAGSSANRIDCSCQDIGYGRRHTLLRDQHTDASGLGHESEADLQVRWSRLLQGCAMNPASLKLALGGVLALVLVLVL